MADVGPSKLLPGEQDRLREAADALLFCESVEADALLEATRDAQELIDHLVASGRWSEGRAGRLADDLAACGPQLVSR